jgi:hypothetical protein
MKCTVKNFQLPEIFESGDIKEQAKEKIAGFGDPQFLVYFQSFPMGEDSDWSGWSPWYEGFGKIMFLSFCVGHLAKPFIALAGWGAKGVFAVKDLAQLSGGIGQKAKKSVDWLKKVAEKLKFSSSKIDDALIFKAGREEALTIVAKNNLNQEILSKFVNYENYMKAVKATGKELTPTLESGLKQAFSKVKAGELTEVNLAEHLTKEEAKGIVEKSFLSKNLEELGKLSTKAAPRAMAYAGIDSYAAWYLSRTDSELGKFIRDYPNSMVLKRPLLGAKGEEPNGLVDLETKPHVISDPSKESFVSLGKPIILDKPEWKSGITPFYLASPCQADLIVQEDPEVQCGIYSYDYKSKLSTCQTPEETGFFDKVKGWFGNEIPMCGSLPTNIELDRNQFLINEMSIIYNMENAKFFGEYGRMVTLTFGLGDSVNREEIIDPVDNIAIYLDRKEKRIDYLGGKGGYTNILDLTPDSGYKDYDFNTLDNRQVTLHLRGPKLDSNCRKSKLPSTDAMMIGLGEESDDEMFYCDLWYIMFEQKTLGLGTAENFYTSITLVWNLTETGEPSILYGLIIRKNGPGESGLHNTYIILKDINGDGKVDELGHYYTQGISFGDPNEYENSWKSVFSDKDYDGKIDGFESTQCKVTAIKITPDREPYKGKKDSEGNSYNYCFKKDYEGTKGFIMTTGAFGVSALAKVAKLEGPAAWVVTTAVDCGIAWAELKYAKDPWPGKEYD